MKRQTLPQTLRRLTERRLDAACRHKVDGSWHDVSTDELLDRVWRVAASLQALGLAKGERVAILSNTRLKWMLADFGTGISNGIVVGIYQSNLGPDCAYILNHSEARILFVEDQQQWDKLRDRRKELPHLEHVVRFDGPGDAAEGTISWDDFLALGDAVSREQVDARADAIDPDDTLSLVYTSGTTGTPKGAMLSHHNLLFAAESASANLQPKPGFSTLLFLPLAHVFARLIAYLSLTGGVSLAFAEDLTKVADNLKEIQPDFIASVPRIYEKVQSTVLNTAEDCGGFRRALFHAALATGLKVSKLRQARKPIPPLLALRHAIYDRIALHKVREIFGGRLRWGVSGAAPLNTTVAEFFDACGVTILEGIGMTENSSFSHVNTATDNRFGTVGPAGPGIETKIAEDGEVLIRGDNVMQGYYKDDEATREAISPEGWLHTGDIGEIDADGYLKITDRKKDLIVTAGGKNVAPQRVERILRSSRFISQVMAYGDRKKYIAALITLERPTVLEWAVQKGLGARSLAELAADPAVRDLIDGEIKRGNAELASFESVKRFAILPEEFTIENGQITPTMKLKRKVIVERHGDVIESLYGEGDRQSV